MEYRPSEIARELGVSKDTLYRGWVPAGAPHRRDESGHIWIVGTELAAWLQQFQQEHVPLDEGEAYCLHCQQAVAMVGEVTRSPSKYAVLVKGRCAVCGGEVARFVSGDEVAG